MDKDTIRLECLRLAVGRTTNQQETLAQAEQFVAFVKESDISDKAPQPRSDSGKGLRPAGHTAEVGPKSS